jgi:uncharacterized membrane protein
VYPFAMRSGARESCSYRDGSNRGGAYGFGGGPGAGCNDVMVLCLAFSGNEAGIESERPNVTV